MNILPKKRWHVRTKENIARVRADEAKAAEEEAEKERRRRLAESEARLHQLRLKRVGASGESSASAAAVESGTAASAPVVAAAPDEFGAQGAVAAITDSRGHINLFLDREAGSKDKEDNPEYIQEQKEEKEKYEKSVGYLTYLGQDTNEATGKKMWYETIDRSAEGGHSAEELAKLPEYQAGAKSKEDPLNIFKKFMNTSRAEVPSHKTPAVSTPPFSVAPGKPAVAASPSTSTSRKRAFSEKSRDEEVKKNKKKKAKKRKKTSTRKVDSSKNKKKKKKEKHRSRKHSKRSEKKTKRKRRRSSSSSSSSSSSDDGSSVSDGESDGGWKDNGDVDIDLLRAQRLQRERVEKARIEELLRAKREAENPPEKVEDSTAEAEGTDSKSKKKYHSQYNPNASAETLEVGRKYWLE